MRQEFLDGGTPGRSTLRRATLKHNDRVRPYGKRYAFIGGLALLIWCIVWLIQSRSLPTTGPLALFYWLHDTVWLTLYGNLWTAMFPYALLWFIPLAGVLGLLLAEWLSPLSTIGLQRQAILIWFRARANLGISMPAPDPGRLHQPVVDGVIVPLPDAHVPFRARVARGEWLSLWLDMRSAVCSGKDAAPEFNRDAAHMALFWARIDPRDSRAFLAVMETMCLAPEPIGPALAAALVPALGHPHQGDIAVQATYLVLASRLARAIAPGSLLAPRDVTEGIPLTFAPTSKLHGSPDVLTLATAIVAMGWAARQNAELARAADQWFAGIATRRITAALNNDRAEIATMDSAMALVDFEFWAGGAERGATHPPLGPWLDTFGAFPDKSERFASTGVLV